MLKIINRTHAVHIISKKDMENQSRMSEFFSVCGNFLLSIGGDNFPIFPGIESVWNKKFGNLLPNISYFIVFQRNNSVIMKNNHGFKKYQLWIKFIFQQLVAKIANFSNIRWNNSVFMQVKKNVLFKTISHEKSWILLVFIEMLAYLHKKLCI